MDKLNQPKFGKIDFEHIFDISPDLICILDPEHNIIRANHAMVKRTGVSSEELVGLKCFWNIHQSDEPPTFCVDSQLLKDGHEHTTEMFIEQLDGWFFVTVAPIMNIEGDITGSIHIARDITRYKKTEEKLLFINKAVESASDAIGISDAGGHHFYQNKALSDLFEYATAEEMAAAGGGKAAVKDPKVTKEMFGNIMNGKSWSGELEMVTKSGRVFPAFERADAIKDSDGNILGLIGIITDFTDRKRADEELKRSLSLTEATLESIHNGILVVSRQGTIIKANKKFAEIWHIPCDILTSADDKTLLDYVLEQLSNPDEFITKVSELYANPEAESLDLIYFRDGRIFERISKPMYLGGEPKGRVWSFLDITERKKAEETISMLAHAIRSIGECVSITDMTDKIVFVNSAFLKTYKYEEHELLGKSINMVRSPNNSPAFVQEILPATLHGGWQGELLNRRKDGSEFPVFVSSTVIYNDNDEPIALIGVATDITERKQAENELIIAKEHAEESDRLKSAFLANMSHEIRTPMNGILGFARLLKEPNLTGEEHEEYIQIIEKSGARMLNIIHDIVDISKIESGQMEVDIKETNINEQIEYLYTFFKPDVEVKGMQLFYKNSLPAKEAIIKTDREKIYAILTNLVKNAMKYTNETTIEFGYEKKGKYLEFFVKDTGIGIAKDRQEAIFERFIQADISNKRAHDGAGLGLSISKAYVEMLGGKIWVESELGKGAAFYFTIPYNAEPEAKIVMNDISSEIEVNNQIQNLKMLIAEDDEASDFLISRMLKNISHEVLHTKTGVETIEACRNNPDIDLVLMDIRMPDLNGYEATRQIRKFNKDVIIIAQTAYGLSGDREKAIDSGCNDYIAKPISMDELLTLIQKYFNK